MTNRLTFDPSVVPDERPGPSGGRRARNRAERTRALCDAARDCFLDEGIDAARIDAIARAAGMSKAAFYRYFEHKNAVVHALFDALTERVMGHLDDAQHALAAAGSPEAVRDAYTGLALSLVDLFATEPRLVRLFLQERHGARTEAREPILSLDKQIVDAARRLTRTAQHAGWVRPFDPEVSGIAVLGAIYELLWRRLGDDGPRLEDLDAANQLVDLVLHGVRVVPSTS